MGEHKYIHWGNCAVCFSRTMLRWNEWDENMICIVCTETNISQWLHPARMGNDRYEIAKMICQATNLILKVLGNPHSPTPTTDTDEKGKSGRVEEERG